MVHRPPQVTSVAFRSQYRRIHIYPTEPRTCLQLSKVDAGLAPATQSPSLMSRENLRQEFPNQIRGPRWMTSSKMSLLGQPDLRDQARHQKRIMKPGRRKERQQKQGVKKRGKRRKRERE